MSEFSDKLNKVMEDVTALVDVLKSDIRDLENEVGLLKRAISNTLRGDEGPSKVKAPEPKAYSGTRNAKELENFLWDMEQYFHLLMCPKRSESPLPACTLRGMRNCGGGAGFKKMRKPSDQQSRHEMCSKES